MRLLTRLWICAAVAIAVAGCGGGSDSAGSVSGAATVQQFLVEGGGFKLAADSGASYLPDNLSPAFQQNGLRVYFTGHVTGASTTQQTGIPIHLDGIRTL